MKACRNKPILARSPIIAVALLALLATNFVPSSSLAANIYLSTDQTELVAGTEFHATIMIDDADGLAGFAATLLYPAHILELRTPAASSGYFTVFADSRADASPAEIDLWHYNDASVGKVLLTGANAPDQPGTEGSKALFEVYFRVSTGAPTGPFSIRLTRTELCNGPAGWGVDANNNGVCDAGDVAEGATVLMKSEVIDKARQYSVLMQDFLSDPKRMLKVAGMGDIDGDGLPDTLEEYCCTFIYDPDSDNDDIWDGVEDKNHNCVVDAGETDPCDFDSDADGLYDGYEDANFNGVWDAGELSPLIGDNDEDGFDDGMETRNGADPLDPNSPYVVCIGNIDDSCHESYASWADWKSNGSSPAEVTYIRFRKENDTIDEIVVEKGRIVAIENGKIFVE